jgi:hypothetical protein
MTTDPPASGIDAYGELLKDELDTQDRRKASFEQRGLAVITTSGVLVTLLFALAALSTKQAQTFVLPDTARDWLLAALVTFVLAAVAAVITNIPLSYQAVDAAEIRGRLRGAPIRVRTAGGRLLDPPVRSADAAAKDIALTRVKALASAKTKNTFKGYVLLAAMALEVMAVGCVAKAVSFII